MRNRGDARTVYSTASGRICPTCGWPDDNCQCSRAREEPVPARPVAKLRLEKKSRGGKTVTVVDGLPRNTAFLKEGEDRCLVPDQIPNTARQKISNVLWESLLR